VQSKSNRRTACFHGRSTEIEKSGPVVGKHHKSQAITVMIINLKKRSESENRKSHMLADVASLSMYISDNHVYDIAYQ
jgi:hypothetical protein